jgi:hypothetical protein
VTKVEGIITLDDILRVYGLEQSENAEADGAANAE